MKYSKDELAVLTLDMVSGITLGKKHKILKMFGSPEEMYDGFSVDQIDFLKSDIVRKLQLAFSPLSQKILLDELENLPCDITTIASFDYPESLNQIYEPPLCLYYRGNVKLLSGEIITFTGTRHSTIYGTDVTNKFLSKLIEKQVVIASGVSDGIDRNVMDKISEDQGTLALVTAGGIDKIVPSINKGIAEKVSKNGLIFSEHRPDITPQKYHYAMRNRIFAGISNAVVIAEAESSSSSLEIASSALEYGKEVFAIPGSVLSGASKGTNTMIAKSYAEALIDEKQLFDILRLEYNFKSQTRTIAVDEAEQLILDTIEKGKTHISEIAEATNTQTNILLVKLLMLEGKGIIRNIGSNRYQKCNF
ncbi:MAG: DNA-processing protein DprA [Bacillota bacterium]